MIYFPKIVRGQKGWVTPRAWGGTSLLIPNILNEQLPGTKNVGGCYKAIERSSELITCSKKKKKKDIEKKNGTCSADRKISNNIYN